MPKTRLGYCPEPVLLWIHPLVQWDQTALHNACRWDKKATMQALIDRGADASAMSSVSMCLGWEHVGLIRCIPVVSSDNVSIPTNPRHSDNHILS
jgi:hypothetical protein